MRRDRLICISTIFFIVLFPLVNSFLLPFSNSTSLSAMDPGLYIEARKRKKNDRYLIGLIFGALLCKLVLFPLAVKAMAVMSSVSVLMSAMGLIISSIVGYGRLPTSTRPEQIIKIHHVKNGGWGKADLELPKGYIPPIPLDYEVTENISP